VRFDINLASRPFQDARSTFMRWGSILGAIACITAALLLIDYTHWRDNRVINEKTAKIQQDIDQLDAQRNANQSLLNQPANRETRDRSQFLNGIIVRKSFSWTRAFSDLEKIMPTRVHLVKIEPELTPQNELKIKMTVAGKSRDKALDLVRKLETSNEFKQARIETETAKSGSGSDAEGTVEFDISAIYLPPPPQPKGSAGRVTEEGD
jgi:hypothetical protein